MAHWRFLLPRVACLALTVVSAAATADAASHSAGGLKLDAEALPWSRWQTRLAVSPVVPRWRALLPANQAEGLRTAPRITLMSDYYFAPLALGERGTGGFRATSGLLLGSSRGAIWAMPTRGDPVTFGLQSGEEPGESRSAGAPYVGIGYSGLSGREGWSFAADLGLLGSTGASVRFGRSSAESSLDEMLRDLRLTPVLQFGVSYSF